MANINIAERENACLHVPGLKMRPRIQSAPEKLLKPSMIAKSFSTPMPSGRKALGIVNKKVSTPAMSVQEKRVIKPQETKVKQVAQNKVEEYPEMEKFFPYDPLEFEKFSVPEDLIPVSRLALPGLACFLHAPPCDDLEMIEPLPNVSPVEMPNRSDYCSELDAFLQTLDELTELPPEPDTD